MCMGRDGEDPSATSCFSISRSVAEANLLRPAGIPGPGLSRLPGMYFPVPGGVAENFIGKRFTNA
jgi:hypothetical protein